jgi:hypothetical protein
LGQNQLQQASFFLLGEPIGGTNRLMRFVVFLVIVGLVVFGAVWWNSMAPARTMSSRVHRGMTVQEVMDSGHGWISCSIRTVPSKGSSELRYMEITSPASASVNTNSSSFPEDKPSRKWPSRHQFSSDFDHRIRNSNAPWQARFVFTGVMNRSDFTVTFGPDAKVTDVTMLNIQPAAPTTDPLQSQ